MGVDVGDVRLDDLQDEFSEEIGVVFLDNGSGIGFDIILIFLLGDKPTWDKNLIIDLTASFKSSLLASIYNVDPKYNENNL